MTTIFSVQNEQQEKPPQLPPEGGQQEAEADPSMVTIAEAATILGLTPSGIGHIILTGKVKAEKRHVTEVVERIMEKTYVSLDDLRKYRQTYGKMGRPKKTT